MDAVSLLHFDPWAISAIRMRSIIIKVCKSHTLTSKRCYRAPTKVLSIFRERPPGLINHVLTVLVFRSWVLVTPHLPSLQHKRLQVCPWPSIFAFTALRANSWICCPQLPYHPSKNGMHSTYAFAAQGVTHKGSIPNLGSIEPAFGLRKCSIEPEWKGLQNRRQGSIEPVASNLPPFVTLAF